MKNKVQDICGELISDESDFTTALFALNMDTRLPPCHAFQLHSHLKLAELLLA
jgi:hypothetical protein